LLALITKESGLTVEARVRRNLGLWHWRQSSEMRSDNLYRRERHVRVSTDPNLSCCTFSAQSDTSNRLMREIKEVGKQPLVRVTVIPRKSIVVDGAGMTVDGHISEILVPSPTRQLSDKPRRGLSIAETASNEMLGWHGVNFPHE
jgi:hypothetical protein